MVLRPMVMLGFGAFCFLSIISNVVGSLLQTRGFSHAENATIT